MIEPSRDDDRDYQTFLLAQQARFVAQLPPFQQAQLGLSAFNGQGCGPDG